MSNRSKLHPLLTPGGRIGGADDVSALWSGGFRAEQVGGRPVALSSGGAQTTGLYGRRLSATGTGALGRALLNPPPGADLPGANDFTVAAFFEWGSVANGYAVVGRWNTGGTPGSNDWFIGSAGVGGVPSGEVHFNVEVGSTTYSTNIVASWSANRPYLLVGRRRGTTILVDRFDFFTGVWINSSTTNAGITTINSNAARTLKLGELDAAASLNSDIHAYGVALFPRALSDDELLALPTTWWRRVAAPERTLPIRVAAGTTYNVTLSEAATAADAAASAQALAASSSESLSAADVIASSLAAIGSASETISASDAVTTGGVSAATLTETVTAADSVAALAALGRAVSESVTATDLVVGLLAAVAALSEAASASDQQSTGPVVTATLAESATAADALQAGALLVVQAAEAATAGDVLAAARQTLALLTESATAADTVAAAAAATYSVTVAELVAAVDLITAALAGALALSAPPIGHGPALATRTPATLRRRAPNISTRTR